jgi:hypothetical protein
MITFTDWCDASPSLVGTHGMRILIARQNGLPYGRDAVAAAVPAHYASEEHVARILERLGKSAAAAFIRAKLPVNKSIRSGDLGEILATEYIAEQTPYAVPIKRLRWKDHRNMAMRGEDVIAIRRDTGSGRLRFLKSEAKSRVNLAASVVAEARAALDKDNGLPSAHALSFVAERLIEIGQPDLADAIDDAQLKDGITGRSVSHLLFTFSGNDPTPLLRSNLENYAGPIAQNSVGLRIPAHADFVRTVFEKVTPNGDNG